MNDDVVLLYRGMLLYALVPGVFGSICLFAFGLRKGSYGKEGLLRKLGIEVLGGTLLATFLGQVVSSISLEVAVSFCLGLFWSSVIQSLRLRVDGIVGALVEKGATLLKGEIRNGSQSLVLDRPDEPERR